MANWWLVVGEPSSRQLLVIKRVTVTKSLAVKLEFTLPKGSHALKLYVICDSYVGADHDINSNQLMLLKEKIATATRIWTAGMNGRVIIQKAVCYNVSVDFSCSFLHLQIQ